MQEIVEKMNQLLLQLDKQIEIYRTARKKAEGDKAAEWNRIIKSMEDKRAVLKRYLDFTTEADQTYRHAMKKIQDEMNHEIIVYPPTKFGISHFEQLRDFVKLMPFKRKTGR